MTSSQDTEITLGTGKLLVLFFGLVAICALFFAVGYSLGRKSEPSMTAASATPAPQTSSNTSKSSSGTSQANPQAAPMTFYKAVEQKEANPELTPATDPKTDTKTDTTTQPANAAPGSAAPAQAPATNAPDTNKDPNTTLPTAGYVVQVAAVTKQEDADALVDALKKKQYAAFVAPATPDKLFRVQVGPFTDAKDAEAIRTRLISDGYSPILKK
jgi:DedD protein